MIRLAFRLGLGWTSRLIARFSAGHLSHVDVKLPNGKLLGARSDNVGGGEGVRERPDPYEPVAKMVYFEIEATPEQLAKFYGFLYDQLGKPYDHLAILAFIWNRNWRDDDAWYCSELVAAALEEAGMLKQTLYLPYNKITPVALATLVSDLPGAHQVN
jgi:uncharacterized protein YycO